MSPGILEAAGQVGANQKGGQEEQGQPATVPIHHAPLLSLHSAWPLTRLTSHHKGLGERSDPDPL